MLAIREDRDFVGELNDVEDVLLLVHDRRDEERLRLEASRLVLRLIEPVVLRDVGDVEERFRFEGLLYEADLRVRFLVVAYCQLLLVLLNEEDDAAICVDEADRDLADVLEEERDHLLVRHPDHKR